MSSVAGLFTQLSIFESELVEGSLRATGLCTFSSSGN